MRKWWPSSDPHYLFNSNWGSRGGRIAKYFKHLSSLNSRIPSFPEVSGFRKIGIIKVGKPDKRGLLLNLNHEKISNIKTQVQSWRNAVVTVLPNLQSRGLLRLETRITEL